MRNNRAIITCRTVGTPADDWYQLFPAGEMKIMASIAGKDKEVTLLCDKTAFEKMVKACNEDSSAENWEGYLVSQEHFAHNAAGSSEAHAWCKELEVRKDGLWGRFEKTTLGESSIGSIYKFRSPVADLREVAAGRFRPVRLIDIGLTNKPKFKTLASAKGREDQQQQEEVMRERVIAALKLDSAATDDQIVARASELLGVEVKLTEAKTELSGLKDEVLAREADAFVEKHADVIEDAKAVKKNYISARETTIALFAGIKSSAKDADDGNKQRVLGREVKTPSKTVVDGGDAKATQHAARVSSRASELRSTDSTLSVGASYAKAQAELGEG